MHDRDTGQAVITEGASQTVLAAVPSPLPAVAAAPAGCDRGRRGPASGHRARRPVIAYLDSSVVLRVVLGERGALREWKAFETGVASAPNDLDENFTKAAPIHVVVGPKG